jgi:hypothetical protein
VKWTSRSTFGKRVNTEQAHQPLIQEKLVPELMRLGAFGFSFSHYEIPPFLTTCLRRGFGRQAEHTEDT